MKKANTARSALIDAFTTLIMAKRFSRISVQEVCGAAQVGRSTFYVHFRNLSELLMAAVAPMVAGLASELFNKPLANAGEMIAHIWQQRRLGELWRDPDFRDQFEEALLLQFIVLNAELDASTARFLAAGVTSILRNWVAGRISASPEEMTMHLISACQARAPKSKI